mgnify:CR=1 FL=1
MRLNLFKVANGGLYGEENPLEVDFGKSKKVSLSGDSGSGKTTALECFKLILGAIDADKKVIEALVNKDSGKLEVEQTFVGKDRKNYSIKLTKSQFYVRQEGSTKDEPQPKSFLKEHLGHIAVDPMAIKNASIDEVIKWLAKYSKENEFEAKINKAKDKAKGYAAARAEANKYAKAKRQLLEEAGYMVKGEIVESKWVAAENKYAKKKDVKELSEKLDEAGKRSDRLIQAETKLKQLKTREEQLMAELAQVQADIKKGEKFVEENKDAKKQYDAIRADYDNAAQFAADYQAWQTIKSAKADLDEYESVAQLADSNEKAAIKEKTELLWEILPDSRGIELVLEDEYEDGKLIRKAGFYMNGFSSRQLSATEYLVAVVKILEKLGTRILILDDVATYGTPFIQLLEQLTKRGWYVLYSEMSRGQELQINY